jgi:cell filamentation protein
MNKRYQVSGAEGEFEPDSKGLVLRNLVGITSPEDMDALELQLLGDLYEEVLLNEFPDRTLTVADLKHWHQLWLGNVYPWAGKERSVNLGKDGFQFATAALLPRLLDEFERQYLSRWTPCTSRQGTLPSTPLT